MEEITLNVPDISCGHCVMTVQETIGQLAGVASVSANEQTKQVQLSFDANRISLAQIETTLDDVGYPVQK
jgi:copper ion binding protein